MWVCVEHPKGITLFCFLKNFGFLAKEKYDICFTRLDDFNVLKDNLIQTFPDNDFKIFKSNEFKSTTKRYDDLNKLNMSYKKLFF